MKSHDLADALDSLAKILRSGNNVEVSTSNLANIFKDSTDEPSDAQIAVNLRTLVKLSKIDKARWKDFISEHHLPIEVKNTYSVRDILGKILNYLDNNPIEIDKIRQRVQKKSNSYNTELDKAFNLFLGDDFK